MYASIDQVSRTAYYTLGQPKLFGGFGFKLLSIIGVKRRVDARFWVIWQPLRCATRPLKSCIFTLWKSDFKAKNAKLHWPGGTPQWLPNDPKFGMYSPFGPKNLMEFETNSTKKIRLA